MKDFDFKEAFLRGLAETGGTYRRTMAPCAEIGDGAGTVSLTFEWAPPTRSAFGFFRITADGGAAEFKCRTDGWEEWQAVDAGRDFAKVAYRISGMKVKAARGGKETP